MRSKGEQIKIGSVSGSRFFAQDINQNNYIFKVVEVMATRVVSERTNEKYTRSKRHRR
jgi:hypothetical protein